MNTKILSPLLFIVAFISALALYWPLMHGTPIWDDYNFWFKDFVMTPEFSYSIVWQHFGWPLSVSIQKFLLGFWKEEYFNYHLLNFIIHGANSLLVYVLAKKLQLKYSFIYFVLFLCHPVAVISVGWMIQIKTLLCFFFAILSVLAYLQNPKNLKWVAVSWLLFLLSVLSKSSSLPLPAVFLLISYRAQRFQKLYYLIPFFIISAWSGYRVLTSPVTIHSLMKFTPPPTKEVYEVDFSKGIVVKPEFKVTIVPNDPPPDQIESQPEGPEAKVQERPKETSPSQTPKASTPRKALPQVPITSDVKTALSFMKFNWELILQSSYYYFWQTFLPLSNPPVRGLNLSDVAPQEFIHLFFLGIVVYLLWNDVALIYLVMGHILLLPYLGIIPAPYMNVTWVSDQHLYLVLPLFLAFWIRLVEKIPWKFNYLIPILFIAVYFYKTRETSHVYENSVAFYTESLEYNPTNVPISYNLAFVHLLAGDWEAAYQVVQDSYHLADRVPEMKENQYYAYLTLLYFQMTKGQENAH